MREAADNLYKDEDNDQGFAVDVPMFATWIQDEQVSTDTAGRTTASGAMSRSLASQFSERRDDALAVWR